MKPSVLGLASRTLYKQGGENMDKPLAVLTASRWTRVGTERNQGTRNSIGSSGKRA